MLGRRELSLMCQIRTASTLEEICNLSFELFGNPIFVEDMSHTILAYTNCIEISHPDWCINEPGFMPTSEQINDRKEVLRQLMHSAEPVVLDDGQISSPRMLKMLYNRGQPVGVAVIPALFRGFQEEDSYILSLISDKMAECLARGGFVLSGNHNQTANLFIQLLSGDEISKRTAAQRFAASYWTQKAYFWVIVISNVKSGIFCSWDELRDPSVLRGNVAFPFQSYYVCIWKSGAEIHSWYDIEELKRLADTKKYHISISRYFMQPHLVQLHYCEAVEAHRLACELNVFSQSPIVDYSQMAFYHMLEMTAPNCNLLSFCDRKILDLAKYDERHGTELLGTLQVYLDDCKDLNASAAALCVHKNTVRYRIAKCLELLGTELEDGAEIFSVLFSIRVLRYCNTLNRIPIDPETEEF